VAWCFFFSSRRRHTRLVSDWSSDVCSSDLLLGAAAGAPFLPLLAQIAKSNLAFAVGLMVLLMVVTVGYLPVVLPLLLPGVAVNRSEERRVGEGGSCRRGEGWLREKRERVKV